jgi:hypothetical protein
VATRKAIGSARLADDGARASTISRITSAPAAETPIRQARKMSGVEGIPVSSVRASSMVGSFWNAGGAGIQPAPLRIKVMP